MIINTWRDPYDSGFSCTRPKQIEINPGLTVLVGCNGAGKSTLLHNIKSECENEDIPHHLFDNQTAGGTSSISELLFREDTGLGATMLCSSEGERIRLNIGVQSQLYKEFLKTGYYNNKENRLRKLFSDVETPIVDNRRVLLFDATDSGMSIDAVIDIKELFRLIVEDADKLGVELYIIIAANEYELACGENCFDVNAGKYLRFSSYEDYKKFILKSRDRKEKRLIQVEKWTEKQRDKERIEFEKEKEKTRKKLIRLKEKSENPSRWEISDVKNSLKNFARECRFSQFIEEADQFFEELKKEILGDE